MLTDGLVRARDIASESVERLHISSWMRERYQTPNPLVRYDRSVFRAGLAMFLGFLAFGFVLLLWVIATDGTPRISGFPLIGIPILVFGITGWAVRVFSQAPSWAEKRFALHERLRVFAVGLAPTTKRYLIVRRDGLLIVSGTRDIPTQIGWSRIDVVALRASSFGVGLSLSIDGEWFDIPLALEVGGLEASMWSFQGIGAKTRFLKAVSDCMRNYVPVYLPGVSEQSL